MKGLFSGCPWQVTNPDTDSWFCMMRLRSNEKPIDCDPICEQYIVHTARLKVIGVLRQEAPPPLSKRSVVNAKFATSRASPAEGTQCKRNQQTSSEQEDQAQQPEASP